MSTEQPGPPTEDERIARDSEWLRVSQLRFAEGYHARMAELHPMRRNDRGEELHQREPRWSFADMADRRCPHHLPAHERERWIAGFLHADNLAATEGVHTMERADPSKPPPRPKRTKVAEPIEAFPEMILDRTGLRERKAADERKRQRDLYARRP